MKVFSIEAYLSEGGGRGNIEFFKIIIMYTILKSHLKIYQQPKIYVLDMYTGQKKGNFRNFFVYGSFQFSQFALPVIFFSSYGLEFKNYIIHI